MCRRPALTLYKDETVRVHEILGLLERAGLMDVADRLSILSKLEKNMDQEFSAFELDNLERRSRKKSVSVHISPYEKKMRERVVLQHELICGQFVDLLYLAVERKAESSLPDERRAWHL
jgi:hypothetical protein